MLRLLTILTALQLVRTQNLLGVEYFVDLDIKDFPKTGCDGKIDWQLTDYNCMNLNRPHARSSKVIKAGKGSCVSTFPIVFFNGSALDFTVYTDIKNDNSGVSFSIVGNDEVKLLEYDYRRTNQEYVSGWCNITISIKKNETGYVRIVGFSEEDEVVLVDSFRYVPHKNMETHTHGRKKRDLSDVEKIHEIETEGDEIDDIITGEYVLASEDDIESSGDLPEPDPTENITTDPSPPETPDPSPSEEPQASSFWTPLTTTLVSVGGIAVLGGTAVGFYIYGKSAAMATIDPLLLAQEAEPPRTVTIPRVTGLTDSRFSRF